MYHQKENKLRLAILRTVPSPTFFSLHKADHVVGTCSSQANTQPSTMHALGHGSAPAIGGQPTTRCHRLFQYHPSPEVNIIVYVLSCRDPKFPHSSVDNDFYSPINHQRNFIFQRHKILKQNGNRKLTTGCRYYRVRLRNQKYSCSILSATHQFHAHLAYRKAFNTYLYDSNSSNLSIIHPFLTS